MQAFASLRVVDCTHVLAGPFCTYQLALLGADVIKVESPTDPDVARGRGPVRSLNAAGLGINYQVQAGNKRAIAIDLTRPEGAAILRQLAERADVLVENYRVGALAALGLDRASLMATNPRLIHCSITGFGQDGPWADRNAYDNVIQAASGMMAMTGRDGVPVKTGASVIDYTTGMSAAFAIAAALHQRAQTGRGQAIDVAMMDCALMMMAPEAAAARWDGAEEPMPREAGLGVYETRDGLLMLGAFNPRQYRRLWRLLDHPEFAEIGDWPDVWKASPAMRDTLTDLLRERTAAEWEAQLNAAGIPAQRVRTLAEAVRLEPVMARGYLSPIPGSDVVAPGAPFRFASDGPLLDTPPPALGQDTDAILAELGLGDSEIARLRQEGTVA